MINKYRKIKKLKNVQNNLNIEKWGEYKMKMY